MRKEPDGSGFSPDSLFSKSHPSLFSVNAQHRSVGSVATVNDASSDQGQGGPVSEQGLHCLSLGHTGACREAGPFPPFFPHHMSHPFKIIAELSTDHRGKFC